MNTVDIKTYNKVMRGLIKMVKGEGELNTLLEAKEIAGKYLKASNHKKDNRVRAVTLVVFDNGIPDECGSWYGTKAGIADAKVAFETRLREIADDDISDDDVAEALDNWYWADQNGNEIRLI